MKIAVGGIFLEYKSFTLFPIFTNKLAIFIDIFPFNIMKPTVFSIINNSEIFNRIIESIMIQMMYVFPTFKFASYFLFHHQSMLKEITLSNSYFSISLNNNNTTFVSRFIVSCIARMRTVIPITPFEFTDIDNEPFFTIKAFA